MPHVVTTPTPAFLGMSGAAEVHQVPVWTDNFSWILICKQTGEAAVVDGAEAKPVLDHVSARLAPAARLTTILTTHTHPDHIGIHRDLDKQGKLAALRVVGNRELARVIPGLNHGIGEGIGEGDTVTLGALQGQAMLTEGHIDGHITYLFDDLLFCGDTLFAGGCGYLFDGPPAKMHASLARLMTLPDHVRVCCAHEYTEDNLRFAWSVEPDNQALADRIRAVWAIRARGESTVPSTIGDERATNPFVRWDSVTIKRSVHAALPDAPLDTPAQVFAATRQLKDKKLYKQLDDSSLPR
ncbi:hydroxyacylglutathione hydrolase [Enhygromyxa salina]|uniref:Hydroxyacylglutathione hydrolase n=1 Tax=Enhygromyxa salina TaxID=215803 RepID=A0A2S9YWI1_9BACT|nr:hydroxyacylglutathione hydrolase [Enhygromyxa salina]PRQ09444.1 Hydroxyacylglutathione hydrolase [Enhygromyxa salina]